MELVEEGFCTEKNPTGKPNKWCLRCLATRMIHPTTKYEYIVCIRRRSHCTNVQGFETTKNANFRD